MLILNAVGTWPFATELHLSKATQTALLADLSMGSGTVGLGAFAFNKST